MSGSFREFAKVTRRRKRRRRFRWALLAFTLGFSLGALAALNLPDHLPGASTGSAKDTPIRAAS